MPRGDHNSSCRHPNSCAVFGTRRQRTRGKAEQQIPKSLGRRLKWLDDFGTSADPYGNRVQMLDKKTKYTNYNQGIETYTRPGSQKK